jgi:hypothetical protein
MDKSAVLLNDAERKRASVCRIARTAVENDHPKEILESRYYFQYGRYVHAYRIPFNFMIRYTSVGSIRLAYRVATVAILLALFAAHLGRVTSALRASDTSRAAAAFGFAAITAALLLFSGLDIFSQSLTHGPSDIVLFAAFAWLSLKPTCATVCTGGEAAALGALAFGFDFLHGTVPMMLAIIVGCAGLRAFGNELPVPLRSTVRLVIAFVVGIAGAVAIKLAATMSVAGLAAVPTFFRPLIYRMTGHRISSPNDDVFTMLDVARSLAASAGNIGWGEKWVPIVALMAALTFALFAFKRVVSGAVRPRQRLAIFTALASIAVIFVWYAVFLNHTAVHAMWMVRLLAWPIGMGCACLVLGIVSSRGRSPDLIAPKQSHFT